MNSIQAALGSSEPVMSLGPFTITNLYATKQGAKASYRDMIIQDGTGKTKLRVWREACNLPFQEGGQFTIQADPQGRGIKADEWQGKSYLSGDRVKIAGSSGAPAQAPPQNASQGAPQTSQAPLATMRELIDYGLSCVDYAAARGDYDPEVLASIYGSAMFGYKEGRKTGLEDTEPDPGTGDEGPF